MDGVDGEEWCWVWDGVEWDWDWGWDLRGGSGLGGLCGGEDNNFVFMGLEVLFVGWGRWSSSNAHWGERAGS